MKRLNPILQLVHSVAELQVTQFLGQLSQDPELRDLPGGQLVQVLAVPSQETQFLLHARHDEDERYDPIAQVKQLLVLDVLQVRQFVPHRRQVAVFESKIYPA